MCSIAGVYYFKPESISELLLEEVGQVLAHRGPDHRGKWINPNVPVGFVHNRLAIVDLSNAANQPMHYAEGRYTVVYNGEVYNYLELRAKLYQKGYRFKTESDTEILPALYDCYGESCLDYIDGMFAFVIWDEQAQKLFCARDRFGEKPFYYYADQSQFLFASEIKGLKAFGVNLEMDPSMLLHYLLFNKSYSLTDRSQSFYKDIKSLPPAHTMTVTKEGKVSIKKYWTIRQKANTELSFPQATNRFKELLLDSLVKRTKTDINYGASLSGGLDSSVLFEIIERSPLITNKAFHTFSAFFPGFEKDEQKHVQALLKGRDKNNVYSHAVLPEVNGLIQSLPHMLYHQEFPIEGPSVYAQYEVMKQAGSEHMKIMIDGQGADETMGGYAIFYRHYFQQMLAKYKFVKFRSSQKNFTKNYKDVVRFNSKFYMEAMFPLLAFKVKKQLKLFSNEYRVLNKLLDHRWQQLLEHFERSLPYEPGQDMESILKSYTLGPDFENILRFSDRNSMAHSIEVRMPFLSLELVEFLFTLPTEYKINFEWSKYILRNAFKDWLPMQIAWRRDKIAFETPYEQWMQQTEVKREVLLSVEEVSTMGLFSSQARDVLNKYYETLSPQFLWRIWIISKMCKISKFGLS